MSHVDELLQRASSDMLDAVGRMPEREGRTVEQRNTRRNVMTGVAATIFVLVVGWIGLSVFGGTPDEVPPITTVEGDAGPTPVDLDAQRLPAAGTRLEPGATYVSDALGPVFSFTVPEETEGWVVQVESSAEVAISHFNSSGPGDRDLWFGHPEALSDPENPFTPGWPIDDLDGWLAPGTGANAGWLLEGPDPAMVGGREAQYVAIASDEPCRDPEGPDELPCPALVFDETEGALWLMEGVSYEFWWIEGIGGQPFVVAAGNADVILFPQVESIVSSLAIAESGTPTVAAEAIEPDADLRWSATLDASREDLVFAADLPDGFPARTWWQGQLVETRGIDVDGLYAWDTSVEPPVPVVIAEVDTLVASAEDGSVGEVCDALDEIAGRYGNPLDYQVDGAMFRAEAFIEYARSAATELGC